ncbi:MAG: hypothetical protein JXB05_36550 [Myxococcaceae bacterium]|nr:hypothetical protein [Myxococcaceae bacterium]
MRPLILISALVWAGCADNIETRHPPTDRFVYPSGIAHLPVVGSTNGALYVASANFDKCFDRGTLLAVNLDAEGLGLPALGAVGPSDPPVEITDLQIGAESFVEIESFAGQMALWNPGGRDPRLFVPTRAEESYLHAIDINAQSPTTLSCRGMEERNCIPGALSLTSNISGSQEDLPRAPAPLGVTIGRDSPEVWVTHIEAADSPARTAQGFQTYLVRLPDAGAEPLSLSTENFISLSSGGLAIGGAHATALGKRYTYVTGRSFGLGVQAQGANFLLRLVDRSNTSRVLETGLSTNYRTLEARDVVLGEYNQALDKERLYIVARGPDSLIVVDVLGVSSDVPTVAIVDAVLLQDGASYAKVIHRGAPGVDDDVVAVTCTASARRQGVVALYDTRLGQIVKQVDAVGSQPFGIALHQPSATAARLFVTNFGDGRVAVIDIPDLYKPQDARLAAYLGARQGRDEKQGTSTCEQQETEP